MDSTALFTAIIAAACGAMAAYRVARGQRWMAVTLAAIGTVNLATFVTLGTGSLLEHRVILIASTALVILFLAASGAARKDGERFPGVFLR